MNARHPLYRRLALALVLLACLGSVRAAETLLYEKQSEYNTVIVTEDANGYRILRFEKSGARQSIGKPGEPGYLGFAYTKVAFVGLALTREPSRILVVGLGGGTMPMFLRKHYPNAHIDAVDIDPVVVHVAREYFGFTEDERMRAHVGDGRQFVERVREPYDVIFLDAFGTRNVPPPLTTLEFMRAVRKAVRPTGVVVGNIWGRGPNPLYDSMVRTYQEAFDELYILDVVGTSNKILLALPRKQSLDRQQLVALARKTGTERKFQFDLGDIDEEQFTNATKKSSTGHVLRDEDTKPGAPRRNAVPAAVDARP
jgi:spermidine synthase